MKKLFSSSKQFDEKAVYNGLSELILQENAGRAVADFIRSKIAKNKKILFLCGKGNNAADAIVAARMLEGDYKCNILMVNYITDGNAKTQLEIAKTYGCQISSRLDLEDVSCIVDGIFGSGLNRAMDFKTKEIIELSNSHKALKIAVDFPSGLDINGNSYNMCFKADFTIAMGVLKLGLYSDEAKDYIGKVIKTDIGLSHELFCAKEQGDFLLQKKDLKLPQRVLQNVHKGDFGNAYVIAGKMIGAAVMTAKSALNIGVGKVNLIWKDELLIDPQIILRKDFDFKDANAIAFGMGLGNLEINLNNLPEIPSVVDADMFYKIEVLNFLHRDDVILTPHPKEFLSLLEMIGEHSDMKNLLKDKFQICKKFSKKYKCTLILKGANTIIAKDGVLYIMPFGSNKLSVGGSGDVLAGIILGFLAQNYSPLDAAINGVIAHAMTAIKYKGSDYSFTPNDMIENLKFL